MSKNKKKAESKPAPKPRHIRLEDQWAETVKATPISKVPVADTSVITVDLAWRPTKNKKSPTKLEIMEKNRVKIESGKTRIIKTIAMKPFTVADFGGEVE